MRFWPRRGRPIAAPTAPSPDQLVTEEVLRRHVEDLLVVREVRLRGGIVAFQGELLVAPARAIDALVERLRPLGYTPFIRRERDGVLIQAWPLGETVVRPRVLVNVVLFALTCASTLLAGTMFSGSPTFDAFRAAPLPAWLLSGVPFAVTLLAILGVHEFGHYFTARHYGAQVSLPYFIPAPPPIFLFGTMGAIIRMRSPARDRNSLFDIAAAGPLAGLAVALPAVILGLQWSQVVPIPPGGHIVFGDSLLMRALAHVRFGPIPAGFMLYTHPIADAAWAGFLVTALNLFPVGQLDGGRIAYALVGRHHRRLGLATVAGLVVMGVLTWSPNWFVWAGLVYFLVGLHHSPPLDDVTPLTVGRRVVGIACLVLLVLLVPPIPITIGR
jgi:membrane-associated protease RseP (regulator of RpoE activity)